MPDIDLAGIADAAQSYANQPQKPPSLRDVYSQTADQDPKQAANVLGLSNKTGQDPAFVAANTDLVKSQANTPSGDFLDDIEKKSPIAAKFLRHPENMAVTHHDIPNVVAHENLINQAHAISSMMEAVQGGAQSSVLGWEMRGKPPSLELPPGAPIHHRFAHAMAALAGDFPTMTAGGVLGAAAASETGPIGMLLAGGAGTFALPAALKKAMQDAYYEGKPRSPSDLMDRTIGILKEGSKQGALGAFMGIAGGTAAKVAGGTFAPIAEETAKAALARGAGEFATLSAGGAALEGRAPNSQDFIDTGLQLAAMHGIAKSRNAYAERVATEASRNFYSAMGKTAEASELRKNLPEAHKQYLQTLTQGTPVENVYIPTEAFDRHWQGQNINPTDAARDLGHSDAYKEAQTTGQDMKVPLADWVSKYVGTNNYDKLAEDVKFNPDALSPNQIKERNATISQQLMQEQAAAEEAVKIDPKVKAAHDTILQDVTQKLGATGYLKETSKEAKGAPQKYEANAKLIADHYVTEGMRRKVDPIQLYNEDISRITSEGQKGIIQTAVMTHGETEVDAQGQHHGSRADSSLNDAGRSKVLSQVEKLRGTTRIIASDTIRSKETAELLGKHLGIKPETHPDLGPFRTSFHGGEQKEELNSVFKNIWSDPDGKLHSKESPNEFRSRLLAVRNEAIAKARPGDKIVFVTHTDAATVMGLDLENGGKPLSKENWENLNHKEKTEPGSVMPSEFDPATGRMSEAVWQEAVQGPPFAHGDVETLFGRSRAESDRLSNLTPAEISENQEPYHRYAVPSKESIAHLGNKLATPFTVENLAKEERRLMLAEGIDASAETDEAVARQAMTRSRKMIADLTEYVNANGEKLNPEQARHFAKSIIKDAIRIRAFDPKEPLEPSVQSTIHRLLDCADEGKQLPPPLTGDGIYPILGESHDDPRTERSAGNEDRPGQDSAPVQRPRPEARHSDRAEGLPKSSTGPTPEVRLAAEIYARKAGLPVRTPAEYVKADPERGKRIADAFEAMKHEPNDPRVKSTYDALIKETLAQYQALKAMGLKSEAIKPGQANPYKSSTDVINDIRSGHLWFFPTDQGFGSDERFNDHPLFAKTDERIDGQQLRANDIFRIVHDFFGHSKEGVGFGPHGEENAWQSHVRMFSPLAAEAMTTETRGQNSWVNFGPHGEANQKDPANTHFADQKAGLLPGWAASEGLAKDRKNPDRLYQDAPQMASPFYSKLQRDIETKLQDKSTPEQVRALMRDSKEDEVKWSGVEDFLKGKDRIDKKELQEHLRANQLEIKEVEKGARKDVPDFNDRYNAFVEKMSEKYGGAGPGHVYRNPYDLKDAGKLSRSEIKQLEAFDAESKASVAASTKYGEHTLPGGENYRELLLTMPEKPSLSLQAAKTPEQEQKARDSQNQESFKSSHWDEANILAHIRFNDRYTSADGTSYTPPQKVLFLEELQSDWHQRGRRQGYKDPDLQKRYEALDKERQGIEDDRVLSKTEDKDAPPEVIARWTDIKHEMRRIEQQRDKGVPDAPFKKTWHEFALKRMIRYAAENGYDKIAWTTGDQQAERYDLSKQVDAIHYSVTKDGEFDVDATGKDGRNITIGVHPAARLSDVVGKDIADKIIAGEGASAPRYDIREKENNNGWYEVVNTHTGQVSGSYSLDEAQRQMQNQNEELTGVKTLSGIDLKVGGEGMKGFYDKILPAFANKFGKKWGAEVGKTKIEPGPDFGGTRNVHAMPITEGLRNAAIKEGFPLFQGERGFFDPSSKVLGLMKGADASTFMHEVAHAWLDSSFNFVKSGNATQGYLEHWQAAKDWLGLKDEQETLTRDQQEKFAKGFEQYLMDGKAPSQELRGVFSNFRRWLTQLYRRKPVSTELSPEIKGFMDRMLATDDSIEAAAKESGYQPSEIQNVPDLDQKTQEKHRTLQERAHQSAEDMLLKANMAEFKRENSDFVKNERDRLTKEAEAQAMNTPVFRAEQDIRDQLGARFDIKEASANVIKGNAASNDYIASFISAAERNGFATPEELAQELAKADLQKAVGERVSQAMEPYSAMMDDEFLKQKALEAIHTNQTGDLLALEGQILQNMQKTKDFNAAEAKVNKAEATADAKAARDQAKQLLAGKSLREAGNFRAYYTAEKNAAMRVSSALANGDTEAAAKAKQQQLLNHSLAAEAIKNSREIEKSMRYLGKFDDFPNDMLRMPYAFGSHINDLLVGAGLKEAQPGDKMTLIKQAELLEGQKLQPEEIANKTGLVRGEDGNWRKETLPEFQDRLNEDYHAMALPDSLLQKSQGMFFQKRPEMSLQELRDLALGVKMLAYNGQQFERFLSDFIKGDLKTNAAELKTHITENIGQPYGGKPLFGNVETSRIAAAVEAIKHIPDGMIPSKVNLLTLCEYLDMKKGEDGHFHLDPDGPAKNNIFRPLDRAADAEAQRKREAVRAVDAIRKKYYSDKEIGDLTKPVMSWEVDTPNGKTKMNLTKENILNLALHQGTDSNLDRVLKGFGIDEAHLRGVTNSLSEKDWQFVKEMHDHVDTYWPEAKQLEMDTNGSEPQKVEGRMIQTPYGKQQGGYWPLSYDYEKSIDALNNAEKRNALYKQFSTAAAHTEQGFLKSRVSNLSRPLDLSFNGFFNHLDDVIHDITHRKAVIDVSRFLNQPDTKESLVGATGMEGYKKVQEDLKSSASVQTDFLSGFDKWARWFRFKTTFAVLAYRAVILPIRLGDDVMNSMREVGPMRSLGATADYIKNPTEIRDFVRNNSAVMQDRGVTRERDLIQMSDEWKGKQNLFQHWAFMHDTLADQAMSYPTWKASYENFLPEYGHQKAVDMADESIIKTFGSGRQLERVGAQRGGELNRLASMYYSWWSSMFNRAWLQGRIAGLEYNEGNLGKAMAISASTAATTVFIPAMNKLFWSELFRNNPQGTNQDDRKKRIIAHVVAAPFAVFPWGRNVGDFIGAKIAGERARHIDISPVESAFNDLMEGAWAGVEPIFNPNKEYDKHHAEKIARAASIATSTPQSIVNPMFNFLDFMQGEGEMTWRDMIARRKKK